MNDLVGLAGFLCACFATALAGLLFPVGAWYDELRKPSWNPRNGSSGQPGRCSTS
jgi:tryptophan-rich sensory protein